MSTFDEMLKTLTKAIKQANRTKTQAYDVAATVTRVEGDIAWVHIPGGVQETPVKLTVAAKPGQTVQVRVSGGRAFLVGNASAPPTDDATAYRAIRRVEATNQVVAQNKADIAKTAERVSDAYQAITEINETAVTGVVVQYAKGTSPTEPPTSGWSSDSQTWEDGKYIWQRTVTTIDGEQIVSNVACIQGARGADGTSVSILGSYNTLAELQAAHPTGSEGDAYIVGTNLYVWNGTEWYDVGRIQGPQGEQGQRGKGVSSLQAQYYLSTSSSSKEGGSWSTTPPPYVNGRYYWTRTRVTWTDNTTTYTTAVLDNGLTNANSNAYQALRTAGNAEDIAEATAQYFWTDTDGVHVASEPELPTATRNTLWNSLGMLFRKGANNLLAILTGDSPGVAIYDGAGNADSNVVAKFGAEEIRFGAEYPSGGGTHTRVTTEGVELWQWEGYHPLNPAIVSSWKYEGDGKVVSVTPRTIFVKQFTYTIPFDVTDGTVTVVLTISSASKKYVFDFGTPETKTGISATSIEYDGEATFVFQRPSSAGGNVTLTQVIWHTPGLAGSSFSLDTLSPDNQTEIPLTEGYTARLGKGLVAKYPYQTITGKYNAAENDAFEIGNGGSDSERSNAMAVGWDGDIRLALDTAAATGTTDGDLYAAITALGWESEVIG